MASFSVMSTVKESLVLGAAMALVPFTAYAQSTVAGFTPGSFRVTESGAAEYRIPIKVPPGIAGMEPKLALVYNSQAGNGLLGVGWSLEGLSAITRCPRTLAQDGVRGGVNYDSNDRYCLDGQRLMLISGASYGADGAEYRTERESFSRIISYGVAGSGPAWFKVWTKGGQVIEYGNTADSRIEAQGNPTVRVWAASRLADTKGNFYSVTYMEDNANGEYYPSRIDYAGNLSLRFAYDVRPDIALFYEAGSALRISQRLISVRTYVGAQLVEDLRLAYDQGSATRRMRLRSITRCDGNGACGVPTLFAPQEGGSTFSYVGENAIGIGWSAERQWMPMDVDGDGRTDVVIRMENGELHTFLSNGTGLGILAGVTPTGIGWESTRQWFAMDVNGDGRADIVVREAGNLHTFLSTGSGFIYGALTQTGISWDPSRQWMPMDTDGDGRSDMVVRLENGDWHVFQSAGATFTHAGTTHTGIGSGNGRRWMPLDVNGDGRSDIVIWMEDGRLFSYLSDGIGFVGGGTTAAGISPTDSRELIPMDMNGDGRSDVVFRLENGDLIIYLSSGAGPFFIAGGLATGISHTDARAWFPMDVNGDGRSDIVVRMEGGDLYSYVSEGSGFRGGGVTPAGISWTTSRQWFPMDVNGDGRTDMVVRLESGYLSRFIAPMFAPDVLDSIVDGAGKSVLISHVPLSQGGAVYSRDSTAAYPVMDVQGPLHVVSEVRLSDGVGGTALASYAYAGLKASADGRGLLGFRSYEAIGPSTGIRVRNEMRQDWPFTGLPSLVRKTTASGTMLSEAVSTYSCTNPETGGTCIVAPGKLYFPFASQSVQAGNDLSGAALPTVTTETQYDGFGNAERIAVSTADGHSKTTINTYDNDVPRWLLGRLKSSTVTSTLPAP